MAKLTSTLIDLADKLRHWRGSEGETKLSKYLAALSPQTLTKLERLMYLGLHGHFLGGRHATQHAQVSQVASKPLMHCLLKGLALANHQQLDIDERVVADRLWPTPKPKRRKSAPRRQAGAAE